MAYTHPSTIELAAFKGLLLSMGVSTPAALAAGEALLAKRLEDGKHDYTRKCRNLLIAGGIIAALAAFWRLSESDPAGVFSIVLFASVIIFVLMIHAKGSCTVPVELQKNPLYLLYDEFENHESMGELMTYLNSLPVPDKGTTTNPKNAKVRSVFAKLTTALMSLLLLFTGVQMNEESRSTPTRKSSGMGAVIDFEVPEIGGFSDTGKVSVGAAATSVPDYVYHEDHAVLMRWQGQVVDDVAEVPSEMNGLPVTEIGERAFENNRAVTKIIVPDTVTTIGSGAFMYCPNLQEIVLPDSVTSIGAQAFQSCSALTSFTAPAGLTALRAEIFNYCTSLTTVTLHAGVTELHARAFNGCQNLTSVNLQEGTTEIPAYCFYGCKSLPSITLPSTVAQVGAYAFAECNRMRSIVMPEAMPEGKISEYAFYNCWSLREIAVSSGVQKISAHAFDGCSNLSSVTIPGSMKTIGSSAFRSCKSLKRISIPRSCSVDERSFKDSPTTITRYTPGAN